MLYSWPLFRGLISWSVLLMRFNFTFQKPFRWIFFFFREVFPTATITGAILRRERSCHPSLADICSENTWLEFGKDHVLPSDTLFACLAGNYPEDSRLQSIDIASNITTVSSTSWFEVMTTAVMEQHYRSIRVEFLVKWWMWVQYSLSCRSDFGLHHLLRETSGCFSC